MLRPLTTYAGDHALDAFAERVSGADEQSWLARGEVERITGVYHDLVSEIRNAGKPDHVLRGTAEHRQQNYLAVLGRLREATYLRARARMTQPSRELRRVPGADHYGVAFVQKSCG